MNWVPIIGAIGLIFRVWLVEFKLEEELQFRRHYLSRILNFYFFIAMILNFENSYFNFFINCEIYVITVSFLGWDTLFFYKFNRRTYWKKNHGWLIIERLTLHIPIIIVGWWMFASDPKNFVDMTQLWDSLIIMIILGFGPWLLWDKRWTENYIYPVKWSILAFTVVSIIGVMIYFLFF